MYTTTKGTQWELTPSHWRKIKACANKRFDGSHGLFNACWREYRKEILPGTDDPENIGDVMGWLDRIAAEKVNNPRSKFWIHG